MAESVVTTVVNRMKRRPGRLFTYEDFADLPATAVAPALSRLTARGDIRRVRKGIYYVPRHTVLGEVPPDPFALSHAVTGGRAHPTGLSAASALGLTTQVPARIELAVEGKRPNSVRGVEFKPRVGTDRSRLDVREAALLEVLRDIGHLSDLPTDATVHRLCDVVADHSARSRVTRAALSEPPRVRAMVGALADAAGADESELRELRRALNPTSRFDFGPLAVLPGAKSWGAR
jgi:hypothetical protein